MKRVLFCASEVHPFAKTGGLADFASSLPRALHELGADIRIVMPGYRSVIEQLGEVKTTEEIDLAGEKVRILETCLPGAEVPVYAVDTKVFDRDGGLYTGPDNHDWPDNDVRFFTFCRAIIELAMGRVFSWEPQLVHCNDWQTGLVPALLSLESRRPATLFAIHNLGYQGLFDHQSFERLRLPAEFWSWQSLEFNGKLSFIKGGLVYADHLVTVSPSYAEEIQTPEWGFGCDGLLRHRSDRLTGILNGIDKNEWDPRTDAALTSPYDRNSLPLKAANKVSLQEELGLSRSSSAILLSHIGRLTHQKGTHLILESLPAIMTHKDAQVVILGSGDVKLAASLEQLATRWPGRVAVCTGFREPLAHRIEAGADIFLMPSLYEPCGLNQMYSMRYGTIPVVRRTGGLKDTVNCVEQTQSDDIPTGFCFDPPTSAALTDTVARAVNMYSREPERWQQMMKAAMDRDFGWKRSAATYLCVYEQTMVESTAVN